MGASSAATTGDRGMHAGGVLEHDTVDLVLTDYAVVPGGAAGAHSHLVPLRAGLAPKAVSGGVVALLEAAVTGPVPTTTGDWDRDDIAATVLHGVAGVVTTAGVVTGPAAVVQVFPRLLDNADSIDDADVLALRSDDALRFAARHVDGSSAADVAQRLYRYGRLPVGEADQRTLPDRVVVGRWLGIDGSPPPPWLDSWRRLDLRTARWWHQWQLLGAPRTIAPGAAVPKLYISPRPVDLPDALRELCLAAAEVGVPTVKVGSDVHAVHRPDKLVAYAADLAQLDALATVLQPRLQGLLPHGVPFTGQRGDDGMLSWAQDPPRETMGPRRSWRQHVTDAAAEGLVRGRAAGLAMDHCVSLAKAWAHLDGIDPLSWTPVTPVTPVAPVAA